MARTFLSCVTVFCLLILEVTDVLTVGKPVNRACVIGAGYSGLAAARYLQQYGVTYTVFEATRHVGGTWRFDPHVGTDEDGLPLFTSQYKYLRTNTPRHTMEYSSFPFPEGTPSYPSGTCFYRYLKLFANKFDLMKNIQLRSFVTSVKWAGDRWNVTYMKTDTRNNHTEQCDFIVVASGEYRLPSWPKIEGQNLFRGNIIHSHDYKEPEPYANRRVLLVGAGASGLDLATHLSNITSKLVHSHHLQYNQPNFSPTYVKKPDIKEFTSNGVIFQDGTFEEIDDVIFCTGYEFDHPFLEQTTGVTSTGKYVLPLYQQTVNIRHPTMTFVGMSKGVINRVMDAQAEYSAALAAGKFQLPNQETMLKMWLDHVYYLQAQGKKIVDVNLIGNQMDIYFANLTSEAGVVRAPPVLTEIRDFNAKNRLEDLLNYRDYDYELIDDKHYKRWYNKREGFPCPIQDS
ncbi:senecionine N-oxygenase [Amyelois transitella]|uniref:senecionine N-oxygenase n=1 Tax=Amyelois transitella TaxID=680683 RepID=UPI00298F8380|nr:senecionine N-oxygenase [Amyelois transitella]